MWLTACQIQLIDVDIRIKNANTQDKNVDMQLIFVDIQGKHFKSQIIYVDFYASYSCKHA